MRGAGLLFATFAQWIAWLHSTRWDVEAVRLYTEAAELYLQAALDSAGTDRLVVIKFFAPWCSACRSVSPDRTVGSRSYARE